MQISRDAIQMLAAMECEVRFVRKIGANSNQRVPTCIIQTKHGKKKVIEAGGSTEEVALENAIKQLSPEGVPKTTADIVAENAALKAKLAAMEGKDVAPVATTDDNNEQFDDIFNDDDDEPDDEQTAIPRPYPARPKHGDAKALKVALLSRGLPLPEHKMTTRKFMEEALKSLKEWDATHDRDGKPLDTEAPKAQ